MILVAIPLASSSQMLIEAHKKLVEAFPPEGRDGSFSPGELCRNDSLKVGIDNIAFALVVLQNMTITSQRRAVMQGVEL
jgi:hypothetical protein